MENKRAGLCLLQVNILEFYIDFSSCVQNLILQMQLYNIREK